MAPPSMASRRSARLLSNHAVGEKQKSHNVKVGPYVYFYYYFFNNLLPRSFHLLTNLISLVLFAFIYMCV